MNLKRPITGTPAGPILQVEHCILLAQKTSPTKRLTNEKTGGSPTQNPSSIGFPFDVDEGGFLIDWLGRPLDGQSFGQFQRFPPFQRCGAIRERARDGWIVLVVAAWHECIQR